MFAAIAFSLKTIAIEPPINPTPIIATFILYTFYSFYGFRYFFFSCTQTNPDIFITVRAKNTPWCNEDIGLLQYFITQPVSVGLAGRYGCPNKHSCLPDIKFAIQQSQQFKYLSLPFFIY